MASHSAPPSSSTISEGPKETVSQEKKPRRVAFQSAPPSSSTISEGLKETVSQEKKPRHVASHSAQPSSSTISEGLKETVSQEKKPRRVAFHPAPPPSSTISEDLKETASHIVSRCIRKQFATIFIRYIKPFILYYSGLLLDPNVSASVTRFVYSSSFFFLGYRRVSIRPFRHASACD